MRAFSLVELSIVLVILGLLTGGILAGQSLIRASELRAVGTEYQRYVTATQTFRDKYFAIPGDFSAATRFWDRQVNVASCVTNSSVAVGTPGTCDGNGDGVLNFSSGAGLSGEWVQFWRQLALSGLIEGSYSGVAGATSAELLIGTNIPGSKLTLAGWGAVDRSSASSGDASWYALDYGNTLQVGGYYATGSNVTAVLRPEEAWNIDTKLDDGKPAHGKVVALYWHNICAAADDGTHANNDYAASYRLSDPTLRCTLIFRQAF